MIGPWHFNFKWDLLFIEAHNDGCMPSCLNCQLSDLSEGQPALDLSARELPARSMTTLEYSGLDDEHASDDGEPHQQHKGAEVTHPGQNATGWPE